MSLPSVLPFFLFPDWQSAQNKKLRIQTAAGPCQDAVSFLPIVSSAAPCSANTFFCHSNMCINNSLVCNGIQNCVYPWDENHCKGLITDYFFNYRCTSGGAGAADGTDRMSGFHTTLCGPQTIDLLSQTSRCPITHPVPSSLSLQRSGLKDSSIKSLKLTAPSSGSRQE